MPTLEFKGKQYIYSHHHSVPFRELEVNGKKSLPAKGKKPSLDSKTSGEAGGLERYAGTAQGGLG